MARFAVWVCAVLSIVGLNIYFNAYWKSGLISFSFLLFIISFYLLYRRYSYSSFGILIALAIVLVHLHQIVESQLVEGIMFVFAMIPIYATVGACIGALVDVWLYYYSRKKSTG